MIGWWPIRVYVGSRCRHLDSAAIVGHTVDLLLQENMRRVVIVCAGN